MIFWENISEASMENMTWDQEVNGERIGIAGLTSLTHRAVIAGAIVYVYKK